MAEWHKSFYQVSENAKKRGLILYGAGIWGEIAYQLFDLQGVNPICYADDDINKQGTDYNGTKVLSLAEAAEKYGQAVFVVCVDDYLNADGLQREKRDRMLDNLVKANVYSSDSEIRIKHYVFLLDLEERKNGGYIPKTWSETDFKWRELRKIILFNNMSNSGSYYVEQLLDDHPNLLFLPYSASFELVYERRLKYLQNDELLVEIMAQLLGYFHSQYETLDSVGQHRYQKFVVDQNGDFIDDILIDPQRYLDCLRQQFEGKVELHTYGQLIKILFAAYANAIGREKDSKEYWIFYHMHLPNINVTNIVQSFEQDEFDRMENLIVIREPVQHLYSWIKRFVIKEQNYKAIEKGALRDILQSELGMMLEVKNEQQNVRAICFEDLKYRTEDTMKQFCKWLDIPYCKCMLETTIQGKVIYFPANTPDGVKYITGNDTAAVKQTQFRDVLSLWDEVRLNVIYGNFKVAYGYYTSVPAYNTFESCDWIFKERFSFCDVIENLLDEKDAESMYDVDAFVKKTYYDYFQRHNGKQTYYRAIKPR